MLKLRTPSQQNLPNPNPSTDNKEESADDMPFTPKYSILKRPTNVGSLSNYASIIIAAFTQSLIPFTIILSSTNINNINSSQSSFYSPQSLINLSYQCSSAIVMSEIFKLTISILIVFYEFNYNLPRTMETMLFDVFQVHTFAISGILYAISTIITIKMISEIGILYQYYSLIFQIFFTLFFWKIVFYQKKITKKQLISILLIIISILFLTFEYNDNWDYFPLIQESIIYNSNINIENVAISESDPDKHIIDVNDDNLHNINYKNGRNNIRSLMDIRSDGSIFTNHWLSFLIIESLFASIGSVITEQKYKIFEKNLSYFAQSSSQYLWSLVISSVIFYIANIKQASKQLLLLNLTYSLEGFNIFTWILVIIYTIYGFSIGYVLKYFNNLVKLLLLSVAICFSHILIYINGDQQSTNNIGLLCVFAYGFVATSVWLYWSKI